MKGFTLLEILVTVLIFSFIVGGIYGVLNIARGNYDTNSVSLNLQRQARQGMNRLSREIRQAYLSSIVPGEENDTITFDRPGENGVTYSLVSGQLWRGYPTGTVIANDITGLTFHQLPCCTPCTNPKVFFPLQKIILEASKTFNSLGKERTLTFSLTEQVTVRNP